MKTSFRDRRSITADFRRARNDRQAGAVDAAAYVRVRQHARPRLQELALDTHRGAAADSVLVRKTADQLRMRLLFRAMALTEATCHVAFKVETKAPATGGLRVLPGLQLHIVDSSNDLVAPCIVGEIAIKGETVFNGYVINGTFEIGKTDGFTPDGYFLTGDLLPRRCLSNLHIVGRSKDMINVGGENVFAWEAERAIRLMSSVKDCAAVPLLHEMLGEIVAVAVVRGDGAITVDEIKAHCRTLLASFKIPQRVYFFEELPRTTTGKVQKHLIVEQLQRGHIEGRARGAT